jgi:hypothetical protein
MTYAAAGPRDASCFLGGRLEVAAPIFIQEYRPAVPFRPDRESGVIAMPAEVTNDVAVSGYKYVVNGIASRTASDIILEVSK